MEVSEGNAMGENMANSFIKYVKYREMALNAFISFCLSNIYPFIYLLIPALFRYLALKKNHEKFYCLSQSI